MPKCRMCRMLCEEYYSKCERLCSSECQETYQRLATERGGYHVLERDLYIIELKKMCGELLVENQDLRMAAGIVRLHVDN